MKAHEPRSAHGVVGRRCAMGRRCVLTAGKAERAELERLSRSAVRGEADRARAVLWSLAGETSAAIAARLGVRAEQVRRWRAAVRSGGVAALRSRPRPGRTPRKREAALAGGRGVLDRPAAGRPAASPRVWPQGPAADRLVGTLARLAAEVAARTGETVSPGHLSVVLRKGATAGVGRGTPSRAGRTRTPSSAPACGSGS